MKKTNDFDKNLEKVIEQSNKKASKAATSDLFIIDQNLKTSIPKEEITYADEKTVNRSRSIINPTSNLDKQIELLYVQFTSPTFIDTIPLDSIRNTENKLYLHGNYLIIANTTRQILVPVSNIRGMLVKDFSDNQHK
jgi:hypothetical protein